jgi:hypothetical protein
MNHKKKITAAISAVINYIQDEEAALYLNAAMAQVPAMSSPALAEPPMLTIPALTTGCSAPASFWGASGRQSQMQLRNLMQLRAFNRF